MSAPPVQGGTQRLSLLSHPRSLASGLPSGGPTAPKGAYSQKSDGIHETQTGTETIPAHDASCPAQEERLLTVLCLKHSLLYSVLWVHSECCQVPFRNEGAGCKSDRSMAWGRHRKASWKREREWEHAPGIWGVQERTEPDAFLKHRSLPRTIPGGVMTGELPAT